jgi:hypothetical protein
MELFLQQASSTHVMPQTYSAHGSNEYPGGLKKKVHHSQETRCSGVRKWCSKKGNFHVFFEIMHFLETIAKGKV